LGAKARDLSTNDAKFIGLTPDFASFSEHQHFTTSLSVLISELNFDHKGKKEGETLTGSLRIFGNPTQHEANRAQFSNGSGLAVDKIKHFLFASGQVDWQHPMRNGEILSVGGSWDYGRISEQYRFSSVATGASLGSDTADQFRGVDNKLAAYATFQQPVGTWTLMPGIRLERDSRQVSSPGHPDVSIARTDVFPTLHVDHALSKTVDLTLSYAKRIDRPQLIDLRPYPLVQDVLTIKEGNPRLQNQSTASYELNLHYHRKKIDAGLIIYDRETSRLWSEDYSVVNGVSLFTIVNAGQRRDRGAEFDLSAPLVPHTKINASINLFDERSPINAVVGSASSEMFRYTTNTTLAWDGPDRGGRPGDVGQLQIGYESPSTQFELHDFASSFQNISYTHSFSSSWSLTGSVNHLSHVRHQLLAPLVQEYFAQRSPLEFRLKLMKTFGKH
jgi:outer membrane receptor for ferrienterochelin and colicin